MRVALYARTATPDANFTTEQQIEELTKYCNNIGWTIYKAYSDNGFSGIDINRPALQEMITDINKGKVDKVLVYSLDRLSRDASLLNEINTNIILVRG